jgi:hypothetical protein
MQSNKPTRNFKPVTVEGKTYPVFYNGRRVLILDSTGDKDADLGLGHSITIWDKVNGWPMGWADRLPDGFYKGFVIYGPHEISISGSDFSELAADCLWQHEWTMRH